MKRLWDRTSRQERLIVIIAVLAFLVWAGNGFTLQTSAEKAPSTPVTTQPAKSFGERYWRADKFVGYTESGDGRVLAAFVVDTTKSKDAVELEIRRFMSEFMRSGPREWTTLTISGYGVATDAYGATSRVPVYTWSVNHDQASKVVDWYKADLLVIGTREWAIPSLMR